MPDIVDVRDSIIAGQVEAEKWMEEWRKSFYAPELKAAARQLLASVPPEVLEQFAFEQPEAWEELQNSLEV